MIEVPAAAIALPSMIRKLDFVAIGTNDLVQYTLAVDRNNSELDTLYDPLHPAVLRLLSQIIAVCARANRPVTLCGEIAGDTRFTRLLIAMGLTDLSMHPALLLDRSALRKHAPALLRATDRAGVRRVLARLEDAP